MGCRAQPGPAAGAHSNGAALKSNAGYEGGSPPSPQISAGPALPAPCSALCSLSISTLPAGLSNQGDAPPPPNAGSSQLKRVWGGSQLSPELEDATELLHGWGLRGGRTVGAPTEVPQGLRVPDRTHLTTGGGGGVTRNGRSRSQSAARADEDGTTNDHQRHEPPTPERERRAASSRFYRRCAAVDAPLVHSWANRRALPVAIPANHRARFGSVLRAVAGPVAAPPLSPAHRRRRTNHRARFGSAVGPTRRPFPPPPRGFHVNLGQRRALWGFLPGSGAAAIPRPALLYHSARGVPGTWP